MPRRAGWMHDYEMALDQNVSDPKARDLLKQILDLLKEKNRSIDTPQKNIPDINININLGDLITKAINTKKTESSVKELIESATKRINRLDEDE